MTIKYDSLLVNSEEWKKGVEKYDNLLRRIK